MSENIRKVYISGGITGVSDYESKFTKAELELKLYGYMVINPANVNGALPKYATTYQEYMKMCITMIDQSDALILLPGWKKSRGARFEKHYAEIMDIPVYKYHDLIGGGK